MSVDVSHLAGTPAPPVNARLELGLSSQFARALKDDNPVYYSEKAAAEAGLPGIPVPPTFAFVLQQVAVFPDLQTDYDPAAHPGMGAALDLLKATGGLILHGEQEFIYHRQAYVGEVLYGTGSLSKVEAKTNDKGVTTTSLLQETVYRDEAGEPVVTSNMTILHRSSPPVTK